MSPSRRLVPSLAAVLLALVSAHCGGRTVLATGDGKGTGPGADGGTSPDGSSPGCPSETELLSVGEACDWVGPCTIDLDVCGTGQGSLTSCTCTGGAIVQLGPTGCIVGPPTGCPIASAVVTGASCAGDGQTCQGTVTCNGQSTLESCTCNQGAWLCPSAHCAVPPVECVPAGPCPTAGYSCTLAGGGPCGSDEALTCGSDGVFHVTGYPCTDEGSGCGTAGACTQSCTCTNGSEVCTMSGDCADAGGCPSSTTLTPLGAACSFSGTCTINLDPCGDGQGELTACVCTNGTVELPPGEGIACSGGGPGG